MIDPMDSCAVCGGDGRMSNSFGNSTRCPACHGTGRRVEGAVFRDVTKTKPSHHQKAAAPKQELGPSTPGWVQLTAEVNACGTLSSDTKQRLAREIVEYEATHGQCTQTFSRKIRKLLRPA